MKRADLTLMKSLTTRTNSPEETEGLGEVIGRLIAPGDVLCLMGNLGAGKTCLVRGVARGWGAVERPTSPTFTLINEYHRPDGARLFHVDCYRLSGVADAESTGLEDDLDGRQIVLIEWPERIRELLPDDSLWVKIQIRGESSREFAFEPRGAGSARLLGRLRRRLR